MWVTARFDVLFKSLNVIKTILSCTFSFLKSYKYFWCCWASCMQPHLYQNLHWYPLTSCKNIWPKISVAYFAKWFQSIFTVGRFSIPPYWALPTYPHRVVKGPHFEAWTRPEPEITRPNPARAWHLFLKPDLGLKAKVSERVKICATAEKQKTLCAGVVAGTRIITPKTATPLTNTLA